MKRSLVLSLLCFAILFAVPASAEGDLLEAYDGSTYHIGTVLDGKIYRSSQPDIEFLKAIKDNLKIKTIISLKGLDDKPGRLEREFCRQNGINLIEIPMAASNPDPEKVEKAYAELTNSENYPLLLHCKAGSDRTGLLIGLYRIRHDGWSLKKARCEMWRYGHFAFWFPKVTGYLKEDHKKISRTR